MGVDGKAGRVSSIIDLGEDQEESFSVVYRSHQVGIDDVGLS